MNVFGANFMKKITLNIKISAILFIVLFTITCSINPTSSELKEEIIINGYLYVGCGIDTVYISKSLKIEKIWSDQRH